MGDRPAWRRRAAPPRRATSGKPAQDEDRAAVRNLGTCARGPVEFDIAHAPEEVSEHYPAADQDLIRECRVLVLAMITTWRWDRDDRLPNGRQLGAEWLSQIRAAEPTRNG